MVNINSGVLYRKKVKILYCISLMLIVVNISFNLNQFDLSVTFDVKFNEFKQYNFWLCLYVKFGSKEENEVAGFFV